METTEKIQAILNDSMQGKVDMEKYIHDICYLLLIDETLSTKEKMVLFAEYLLDLEVYSGCPISDENGCIAAYVEDLE
nr:MAG TPA: hypothetical protein [Caudoviricetes sp.]